MNQCTKQKINLISLFSSIVLFIKRAYYDELSALADIENVREFYMKIYDDSTGRATEAPNRFRDGLYRIIDDENFERTSTNSIHP